jgi:hypothetical protein
MDGSRFKEELPDTVVQTANVIELNIDTKNQQPT